MTRNRRYPATCDASCVTPVMVLCIQNGGVGGDRAGEGAHGVHRAIVAGAADRELRVHKEPICSRADIARY